MGWITAAAAALVVATVTALCWKIVPKLIIMKIPLIIKNVSIRT